MPAGAVIAPEKATPEDHHIGPGRDFDELTGLVRGAFETPER